MQYVYEGLEDYKKLYSYGPPGWGNAFFAEVNTAIAQGQVAMGMNYFAFFPSLVNEATELATVHYVRQGEPKGLGHAVLCAAQHVGHEPFAVLLGDDLIDARDPLLARMVEVQERLGGSVIALIEVEPSQIELYGCAAVEATAEDDVVRVTDLIEKPKSNAPSNLAIIGRYVIAPEIFDVLRETKPGAGGVGRDADPRRLDHQRSWAVHAVAAGR